jgi:Protein of unknown function (DUF3540)
MPVLDQPFTASGTDLQAGVRLGSAVVTIVADERVTVLFQGCPVTARLALAFAYTPLAGDLVLLIVQGNDAFIIGVLSGRGTTTLSVHGDLTIAAPTGRIRIAAGKGVELEAPEVGVRAQRFEVMAAALVQRVQSALLAVTDLLHITAGQRQTTIHGPSMETTQCSYQRAEKEVVIQAETVSIT